MAITVLDVRGRLGAPLTGVSLPPLPDAVAIPIAPGPRPGAEPVVPAAEQARLRLPFLVVAAALAAGVEAVALLAAGLTGLSGFLTSAARPSGLEVALVLGLLASWIVLCAGGGAALLDGAGRRLYRGVAHAEFGLVGLVLALRVGGVFDGVSVPLTAFALLALSVPTVKLLIAGAPSVIEWVAQGPRPREQRPDPVARHRGLCAATLVAIALTLGVVALTGPAQPGHAPVTATAGTAR